PDPEMPAAPPAVERAPPAPPRSRPPPPIRIAPPQDSAPAPAADAPSDSHHHHHHGWHGWGSKSDRSFSLVAGPSRLMLAPPDGGPADPRFDGVGERALTAGLLGTKVLPSGLVLGLGGSYTQALDRATETGADVRARAGHLYG